MERLKPVADSFLDCASWQEMIVREPELPPGGCIGIVRQEDFVARCGVFLTWHDGFIVAREFVGNPDMAVLLVVGVDAVNTLRERGFAAIPALVRQGKLHPYILKTMEQLEDAGILEFVENVGLVFPRH